MPGYETRTVKSSHFTDYATLASLKAT